MKRALSAILLGTLMIAISAADASASTCKASWYGPGFNGRKMANGQRFNQNDPTIAAHKSYAFGTRLRVTNLDNGKTIIVIVKDRGPYRGGRCLDLSHAAARQLGYLGKGVTTVTYTVVR